MTPMLNAFTPFKFLAVAARAGYEAQLAYQDAVIQSLERIAKEDSDPITWTMMPVPMVNAEFFFDEDTTREGFQKLADSNLRGWEYAADYLKALPAWANWPVKVPGSMMTDVFDRMRRAGLPMMAANDSWRTAAENFSPPVFWRAAASSRGPDLLDAPNGAPDDLTQIKGIGAKLSAALNELGVYHFSQIASWSQADGEWIDDQLAFKGRVAREDWISHAQALAGEIAA